METALLLDEPCCRTRPKGQSKEGAMAANGKSQHRIEISHSNGTVSWGGSIVRLCLYGTILAASWTPAVLAYTPVYQYVTADGEIVLTDVPLEVRSVDQPNRYHRAVSDAELEWAVGHAAREHRLQPALLLAVMKAESSFNPVVVFKAGAVGLMQLIPETAIRHGVRNLYDTRENVAGGARHLRYLLDRFKGNLPLALAAYNAGERNVDRYGKIPPYKETRLYVQKVMAYYKDYKKVGWVVPVNERNSLVVRLQAY